MHRTGSGSMVKNLPATQELLETWVRSLGWEDALEEEMATHSSILAWRIPWTEEFGRGVCNHGVAKSDTTEQLIHTLYPELSEQCPLLLPTDWRQARF